MKIIESENRLCTCCMEVHDVKKVLVSECTTFKSVKIEYDASYLYCDRAEEFYMNEDQIQENDIALKNAYRNKMGLLTSKDIVDIRSKYQISQTDFCILLGWGGKTITRYESHQVQDRAHDTILKKIDGDPEWFLDLLKESAGNISKEAYRKYFKAANRLFGEDEDLYLKKAIEARYAKYRENMLLHGNVELSLNKTVDVIRYFAASEKVTKLYKVKLMKIMWYADALSYRQTGFAITGLVYQAMPMGAVPIGHDAILQLKGVPCEEKEIGDMTAYYFSLKNDGSYPFLSDTDKWCLNSVIDKLGKMSKDEIVEFMHKEQAFQKTPQREIISYEYAESLQI